jgi:threonine dehydrogenase-like Zn-dependent dehydrogenase
MTVGIAEQAQLVLESPGKAAWAAATVPALDGATGPAAGASGPAADPAGAALVRPLAVATCDLDTAVNSGAYPLPLPYALGHEFIAEVIEVGPDVTVARPGDRVAVPFQINCGYCGYCTRGLTGDCGSVPHVAGYGLGALGGDWGGAMSDVVRVPFADAMLVPLPTGVEPAAVASMDNLADGYRTVAPHLGLLDGADFQPGPLDRGLRSAAPAGGSGADRRMLVMGGQSVGLYAVAIARAMDIEVTYLDRDPRRLAIAERLGAAVGDVDDRTAKYRLTVHTSGRERNLLHAVKATDRGGTLVDTGIFPGDVALPMLRMYTVGVTVVTGRAQARRDMPGVLDLVARGRLDPSVVTATTVGWSDAAEAWSAHHEKLVVVR